MNITNPFKNTRIEYHILQSFPVTCLNRDDVGAPKTAMVGGSVRARVSSQCWKRQVRLAMREFGVVLGTRTKLIAKLVKDACVNEGATEEQALACAEKVEQVFVKKQTKGKVPKKKKTEPQDEGEDVIAAEESKDNDTLIFLSPKEVGLIAQKFKEINFDSEAFFQQDKPEKQVKELAKLFGGEDLKNKMPMDAVDIALFGRMVAKAAEMNVEAAASFSHAISTHRVSNEVEFFTAIDDLSTEQGSAHMGSLEFNSATYYRYISLDLGQLYQTLSGVGISEAIEAFTKALYVAIPSARQATQSGASAWEFAKIFVRNGQRLQVPFETAIKVKEGGFLQPSIDALKSYLAEKEKQAGSLFRKQQEVTIGSGEDFNIDGLIAALKKYIHEGLGCHE